MSTLRIVMAVAASLVLGCGADAPGAGDPGGDPSVLPTWMLEDVQPESPRANQTYGVDAFSGQIVVVTLVAGF